MFDRFAKSTRLVVHQATEEARALGSRTIEAEHLLLALAAGATPLAAAMAQAGAGHEQLLKALDAEMAAALDGVGVSLAAFGPATAVAAAPPKAFGTSAKRALEQTLRIAGERGDRRLEPGHLLLALLRQRHGTLPRVLAIAGLDAAELERRALTTL